MQKAAAKLNDEQQKTWKEISGHRLNSSPTPGRDSEWLTASFRRHCGDGLVQQRSRSRGDDPGSRFHFDPRSADLRGAEPSVPPQSYSTVTLLARLRGLSMSQPRRRAT